MRKGDDLDETMEGKKKKKTLKKQNYLFRQKLKELNEMVEKAIDRTYVKRMLAARKKTVVDVGHRNIVLDKEMDNAEKQIEAYKKEINSLNVKIDEISQVDTMLDREQGLKENKAEIIELKKTIKVLEKQSKDIGKELLKLTEGDDYNYKIRNLIDEIRMWKEKIRHRQEVYDKAENTTHLQTERLSNIERDNAKLMSKVENLNCDINLNQNSQKSVETK